MNNTPVVAMFIPVVNDWCKKTGISPSKLFIPLSYAAVLGGTCTLGTSTNLVVHALMIGAQARDPEMPVMSLFTLGPVGVPCVIVGLVYLLVASRRLLPTRTPLLAEVADPRQYTVEMQVEAGSPIDGVTIERAGLRHLPGTYLSAIERDG